MMDAADVFNRMAAVYWGAMLLVVFRATFKNKHFSDWLPCNRPSETQKGRT